MWHVALPCFYRRPEPNTDKPNSASREVLSHVLQPPIGKVRHIDLMKRIDKKEVGERLQKDNFF